MKPDARVTAGAVLTAIPLIALLFARAVWSDALPESMAVHWSGSTPDRYGSPDTYFWIALGVSVLAVAVAAIVAVRSSSSATLWIPAATMMSWTAASTWILSVALTKHAGRPEDAHIGAWIVVPLFGIVLAVVAFRMLPRTEEDSETERPVLPTPLTVDEHATWTGHVHGRWAGILTLVMTVATTVSAFMGAWWITPLFAALVVVGGAFMSVTIRIDRRGIAVFSWGVRWKQMPLNSIEYATTENLDPVHWGGWGYRITPRGTAILVRAGEGIVMIKHTGRRFAVTVDSPETGAALINSLLAAEAAHRRGGIGDTRTP